MTAKFMTLIQCFSISETLFSPCIKMSIAKSRSMVHHANQSVTNSHLIFSTNEYFTAAKVWLNFRYHHSAPRIPQPHDQTHTTDLKITQISKKPLNLIQNRINSKLKYQTLRGLRVNSSNHSIFCSRLKKFDSTASLGGDPTNQYMLLANSVKLEPFSLLYTLIYARKLPLTSVECVVSQRYSSSKTVCLLSWYHQATAVS